MKRGYIMNTSNINEWKDSFLDWFALIMAIGFTFLLLISGVYALVGFIRLILGGLKRQKHKMFNCSSCGSRISYEAKHCPKCGHHYGESYPAMIAIPISFLVTCICLGFGVYFLIFVLEMLLDFGIIK